MEAVVTENSLLADHTPSQIRPDERYGVHLLAVSRSGKRITQRMRSVSLRAGDVVGTLGLPLSIMVVIVGVPPIALFWPFRPV
jgi:uncharacterized protein with PhoU and TrkA domain